MQEYEKLIRAVPLFKEIEWDDFRFMLNCLRAETKVVQKNGVLLLAGDKPLYVGIVLVGRLHVVAESEEGNRTLISVVFPGEVFAEAMCCANVEESPVTVLADEDATVLLLDFSHVFRLCKNLCSFHQKLIKNMLRMLANENLFLQNRLTLMSIKSIREKVLRYLESFVPSQGRHIVIPFNQTKLAEYLCVDRSALAHELARMKRDGLIDYKKNAFTLK